MFNVDCSTHFFDCNSVPNILGSCPHCCVHTCFRSCLYTLCFFFLNMNSSPTGPRNTPTGATSLHVLLACDLAVVGSLVFCPYKKAILTSLDELT